MEIISSRGTKSVFKLLQKKNLFFSKNIACVKGGWSLTLPPFHRGRGPIPKCIVLVLETKKLYIKNIYVHTYIHVSFSVRRQKEHYTFPLLLYKVIAEISDKNVSFA